MVTADTDTDTDTEQQIIVAYECDARDYIYSHRRHGPTSTHRSYQRRIDEVATNGRLLKITGFICKRAL